MYLGCKRWIRRTERDRYVDRLMKRMTKRKIKEEREREEKKDIYSIYICTFFEHIDGLN